MQHGCSSASCVPGWGSSHAPCRWRGWVLQGLPPGPNRPPTATRRPGMHSAGGCAWRGGGIAPDATRALARHLFEERGHRRLTIDPATANERAIRAYERVGVRRVGVMRAYERGPDGGWHDGLLMDLLPGDLRPWLP